MMLLTIGKVECEQLQIFIEFYRSVFLHQPRINFTDAINGSK